MTTLQEALPCPFCGKQHTLQVISGQELMGEDQEFWQHSESFGVVCDASTPDGKGGCGATGGFKPTEDEAIEAWNTRTTLAQQGEQQPVDQWQKRHTLRTQGKWENTDEHDAKWWRNNSAGWEIRSLYTAAPAPQAQEYMKFVQFGGCPFCGKRNCVAGSCRSPAPQPAQGGLEKLRAPLIQWHQNMAEVCRDSDGTAHLNHRDTAALLQSAQPVAQPLTVDDFEEWHKANFAQPLDRHGYTYSDASVRNRWIGWQAAHGIREVK